MDDNIHTNMQALANIAHASSTDNNEARVQIQLAITQWEKYITKKAAASTSQIYIEILCQTFVYAMNDGTSKEKREIQGRFRGLLRGGKPTIFF